jgi:hypothetical protein
MTLQAIEFIGALIGHLRDSTDLMTAANNNIAASLAGFNMPNKGILVRSVGGGDDSGVGHLMPRVDLWTYATQQYLAMDLWGQAYTYLLSPARDRDNSFRRNGIAVYSIELESGPTNLPEPDTGYPRVVGSYLMRVAGVLL